jgi:hypothetical protein
LFASISKLTIVFVRDSIIWADHVVAVASESVSSPSVNGKLFNASPYSKKSGRIFAAFSGRLGIGRKVFVLMQYFAEKPHEKKGKQV